MNRLKFVLGMLGAGMVYSATAQVLDFTNLTLSTSPNLFHGLTNQLNAVAYGGSSNFVAVGANQIYVCGNFQPGQSWITKSDWATNIISPAYGLNLYGVASGSGQYVATGASNAVFSATTSFMPAGLTWSQKHNVFSSSVVAPAIAYSGNGFSAVAEAPEISWSSTNLPTATEWLPGTLASIDFAESFRGITAYATNGYAACGLFADVRLSNDGTNWQAAVSGHIGQPDLYAIAYDGAHTFVAVGATNSPSSDNGIILAATNSAGTNWQTVFVNATNASPINAVTYNGSRFVAVGTAGQVLTSTNGVNWVTLTNTVTSTNLYGVTFATTGYMAGIGELVGSAGTVILAGLPPPAITNGINATNCASYPITPAQNDALTAIMSTNVNYPLGSVSANWFDVHGNPVTNATTIFYPTNNPNLVGSNAPVSYTYYAEEMDLRTGFINTNLFPITLQINPRPTSTLTTLNTTNCNEGSAYVLMSTLTGIGPWTVTWNDGTVQTTNGAGPVTLMRTVYPTNTFANIASNNVYYVTSVSNADMCLGNVPGDILGTNVITIDPLPTETLMSFNTTNCNEGTSYTLTNTLTGIGPWTLYWNDGTIQSVPQAGSGPFVSTRTVYPTNSVGANVASNNVYYVTIVTNADMCIGNRPGDLVGTNTITINPRPTATLTALNISDCNLGDSFILTNTLTGIGPWTIYWNDGTIQTAPQVGSGPVQLTRTVYPTNSFANAASNNVYYVTIVTNADTCMGNQPGDLLGTNTITINPRPTSSLMALSTTNCNEGTPYTLTNTLTGIGPWTVYWNDGTVQVANGAGPLLWTRTVYPTNSVGANTASNNIYYVTVVSNTDMCTGNLPGDVTGTNNVVINPRPTATLTALNVSDCNLGDSYTLTNTLTGIGPWTIYWNDGTIQSVGGSGPVTLTRTVYPTNNFANAASNNVYYVTIVTNADTCMGNQPGDLIGTNTITINPLPTATLASLSTTNCNEGTPYTLTNTLTGIGPWTLFWNDGTTQVANGAGPLLWTRTVYPTNSVGANTASNNVYYVTVVSNADTCTGNITGTNNVVINPLPTATLMPFSTTNCNEGTSYTLTNTLTGIGPWTVYWNDGSIQTTNGSAPLALLRTVFPTNSVGVNTASNNVYYVTIVTNADMCIGNQPGDIAGTNNILINPSPTVALTISAGDFAVSTNGISTGLLERVANLSGTTYSLTVGFQYLQNGTPNNVVTQTLSVTNHLAFTGTGPWTIVLSDGNKTSTNTFAGASVFVWQETISTNYDTNFTFTVQSVQTTNTTCSGTPTNSYSVLVYDAPTALVYTTNTICGSATNSTTISAILGGFGPWTNVVWSDGFTNSLVTSNPLNRSVPTPTNSTLSQIVSNYTIVSLADNYGATTTSSNDLTGSARVIVDPYTNGPPGIASSLNFSCDTIPIQLSVSVPNGFTANWFNANTNLLTNGVTTYLPPAPGVPMTNVYLVAAIYNDTNLNDGCDSPFAVITNVFDNCTNAITAISLTGTNAVVTWNGNFILQGTTNLLPPTMWINISTGSIGANFLTNSATHPPIDFFRLYAPTN